MNNKTLPLMLSLFAMSCDPFGIDPFALPNPHFEGPVSKPTHDADKPLRGPTSSVFSRARVLEIELELESDEWEILRHQGRGPAELFSGTVEGRRPFSYTTFEARATVGGVPYPSIGLRKAGYIDLSSFSPELELDFTNHGSLASGLHTLALKNDFNDSTLTRECMALDLYRAAGYPASRCNLAHVTVNGVELGYYVNVEAIDEQMLAHNFTDSSGDLYRGELADFFESTLPLVRNVNTPRRDERSALQALVTALDSDDQDLVASLGEVLDLSQFRDFWALETLLGHWDGYTRATNNFYLYRDPSTHLFVFLPWDLDQAFEGTPGFGPAYQLTVYYSGRIANRLYANPEQRQLFRARLGELNDNLWNEGNLLAQVDRFTEQMPNPTAGTTSALDAHREYLRTHGQLLREALIQPAPEVPITQPFSASEGDECAGLMTQISGTFSTVVSTDIYSAEATLGSATLNASPDGLPFTGSAFALAGPDQVVPNSGSVYVASEQADGSWLGFVLILPEVNFVEGLHPLHSFETFIPATTMTPLNVDSISTFGFVSDGHITLDQASISLGNTVSGSFSGTLVQHRCSQVPASAAP